ncbi:MAG: hypothetical protein M3P93_04370 [Actinomycetota bacterium]|nr:hypothetical protein [Actinomycetota bacterium]
MKEDVLEQVVDDYLRSLGFLTHGNVKYKPSPKHPDYAGQKDSGWATSTSSATHRPRYGRACPVTPPPRVTTLHPA